MPRYYTILRVFIASPGDVADERSLVEQLIDEYNRVNKSLDMRLELVGWEQDVIPGLGTDPQAVVNDQIGDDYDIFIGILWTRFGTPTPRASSGTKEEFDRAYQRFLDAPDTLRIMIYFSERPTNPADLEPSQIELVQGFRKEVGEKGIYGTYKTQEEFQNLVRINLARLAQEWGRTWGTSQDGPSQRTSPVSDAASEHSPDDAGDTDAGLLDLVIQGSEAMEATTQTIERITKFVEGLSDSLVKRTSELKAISDSNDPRLIKRFVDRAADDLLTFADQADREVPVFAENYGAAMDAAGRSATLLSQLGPTNFESVRESRDALRRLTEGMETGKAAVTSMSQSIGSLPPMSTSLNRARSRAVATLDGLAAEWERAISTAKDVDALYERALRGMSDQSTAEGTGDSNA